jgi:hypothetical protein
MNAAPPRFALAAGLLLLGCTALQLQPPVRMTVPMAAGAKVTIEVQNVVVSQDMLVDDPTSSSRLAFQIEFHNESGVPARLDPAATRLIARVAGADRQLEPTSSGWGRLPSEEPPRQALAVDLPPGDDRQAWLIFPVPPEARPPSATRPDLLLQVTVGGKPSEVVVAGRGGPRWLQSTRGPLGLAIYDDALLAPGVVADELGWASDFGPLVHTSFGVVYARHDGHGELGFGWSLQLNVPLRLEPTPHVRIAPFASSEFAFATSSYPARYPHDEIMLFGAGAGIQVGFGVLRPPGADHLPVDYPWTVHPVTLRVGYVRWWGQIDQAGLGDAGRSGLLAGITLQFGS